MLRPLDLRLSGTLLAIAGASAILVVVLSETVNDDFFYGIAATGLLTVLGLPALPAVQPGKGARVATRLVVFGLAVVMAIVALVGLATALTSFDPDDSSWPFPILLVGFVATIVGLLVLGISILRGSTLPRPLGALLAFALPLGLLIDTATGAIDGEEEATAYGFWVGVGGFGLGLLLLGLALRSRASEPTPPAEPA